MPRRNYNTTQQGAGIWKLMVFFLSTCDRYVNYIKSCLLQSEWEAFGILDFLFHVPETPRRFIWPFRSSYFHNYHIFTCPPCQQCLNNVHVHNVEHDQFILYVHNVNHLFIHFTCRSSSASQRNRLKVLLTCWNWRMSNSTLISFWYAESGSSFWCRTILRNSWNTPCMIKMLSYNHLLSGKE